MYMYMRGKCNKKENLKFQRRRIIRRNLEIFFRNFLSYNIDSYPSSSQDFNCKIDRS